jgi:amino acid transporter
MTDNTISGDNRLRSNSLGVGAITFMVISAAAPLTVVASVIPLAMLLGNGVGATGAFLASTIVLLLFAVGYVAMARHTANAGGFYAMTTRGLGGRAGGAMSMVAILSYNCMQIGVQGLVGVFAAGTFSMIGIDLPWYVWSFVSIALVAVLGYRQVDLSARILMVLVALEFLIVLVLLLAILFSGGAAGLSLEPFSWAAFSPALALLFCFASFVGFEATVLYSEEARDPKRSIPQATYLSVIVIGVFYVVSTWLLTVGEGVDTVMATIGGLADPTTFTFVLAERYVGSTFATIMQILLLSSAFAAVLAFHNGVARYKYVSGREGLLPEALGVTHDMHKSPHMGSLVQTALSVIVVGLFAVLGRDPLLELFTWLSMLGTLGVIGMMAVTSAAVLAFFMADSRGESTLKTRILPVVSGAVLGWLFVYIFINFSGLTGTAGAMGWILPGLVIAAAIIGWLLATGLRARDPERFAQLGKSR